MEQPKMGIVTSLVQGVQNLTVSGRNFNSTADRETHHIIHYNGKEVTLVPAFKSIPDFRGIQIATLGKAIPGTFLWIFETDTFRIWLDVNGYLKIMWGSGMPGVGKTVFASIVIDALERHARESAAPICVCYIYIRKSEHVKMTVQGLLEVLVKQTVERHPNCLPFYEEIYANHVVGETRPSEEELLYLLRKFTEGMAATYYFLEALDEAPVEIQTDLVKKLASLDKVRLFITSRPMEAMQAQFPDAHCFTIAPTDNDLEIYVNHMIANGKELSALLTNLVWRAEVVAIVKEKCRGSVLHAFLQLNIIKDCTSVFDIKETLSDYPLDVEGAYELSWGRLENQASKRALLAKTIVLWSLFASRPMTVREMQYAGAVAPEDNRYDSDRLVPGPTLLNLCRGLATIEKETGVVRFIHYSAKETLGRLCQEIHPHPPAFMLTICLIHLTHCKFQNTTLDSKAALEARLTADPLLAYAYDAWYTHAWEVTGEVETERALKEFVKGCQAFPVVSRGGQFSTLGAEQVVAFFNLPVVL